MSKINAPANWNWPRAAALYDTDPMYWGLPFYERAYLRAMYAAFGFIVTASFFDGVAHSPLWMQCLLGGSVALAILLFRWAYPAGFTTIQEWIMEGMDEAAKELEAKGKTPGMSSKEIERQLKEHRKTKKIAREAASATDKSKNKRKRAKTGSPDDGTKESPAGGGGAAEGDDGTDGAEQAQ